MFSEANNKVCLVQFAKSPMLGKVKTRLSECLPDELCLKLHIRLLLNTYNRLNHGDWDYQLWLSHESEANNLLSPHFLDKFPVINYQPEGDLGIKMLRCFASLLKDYEQVILVGSDCPYLSSDDIKKVILCGQQGTDVTFIPADDGGYVLLGLKRVSETLFQNISWGGSSVFNQSVQAAETLGWSLVSLNALSDIDRPSDLMALCESGVSGSVLGFNFRAECLRRLKSTSSR